MADGDGKLGRPAHYDVVSRAMRYHPVQSGFRTSLPILVDGCLRLKSRSPPIKARPSPAAFWSLAASTSPSGWNGQNSSGAGKRSENISINAQECGLKSINLHNHISAVVPTCVEDFKEVGAFLHS